MSAEDFDPDQLLATTVAYDAEAEEGDWIDTLDWLNDRDWEYEYRPCLRLAYTVQALIYGGRPLHIPGDTSENTHGLAYLEALRDCVIQCAVCRRTVSQDGREIIASLVLPHPIAFLGYDEEGRTAQAHTVGPRAVGPPPDIYLRVSPSWLLRLDEAQREAELFNQLVRIGRSSSPLRAWNISGMDIKTNAATVSLYGPILSDSLAVVQSAQRHIDMRTLTDAQLAAVAETLPPDQQFAIAANVARSLGYTFYRPEDGTVVGLDGEQVGHERDPGQP